MVIGVDCKVTGDHRIYYFPIQNVLIEILLRPLYSKMNSTHNEVLQAEQFSHFGAAVFSHCVLNLHKMMWH